MGFTRALGLGGVSFIPETLDPMRAFSGCLGRPEAEGLEERGFRACWAETLNDEGLFI